MCLAEISLEVAGRRVVDGQGSGRRAIRKQELTISHSRPSSVLRAVWMWAQVSSSSKESGVQSVATVAEIEIIYHLRSFLQLWSHFPSMSAGRKS